MNVYIPVDLVNKALGLASGDRAEACNVIREAVATYFDPRKATARAAGFLVARAVEEHKTISSPEDAAEFLCPWLGLEERERFVVLLLDSRNRLLGAETVSTGTVNQAPVYPREVARQAILHNATAVILAHNHPTGNPLPSTEDRAMTETLRQALKVLDVNVHDHLVVTAEGVRSVVTGQAVSFQKPV